MGSHQAGQVIDEFEGLVQRVLSVGGRRNAEGQVVWVRGARVAVVGHAIGVVAAGGFHIEAARALQIQRDRQFGEAVGVFGVGEDFHRGVACDVGHAGHGGRDVGGAAVQFVDVQLDDGSARQGDDGEVTEDGSSIEASIDLAQRRQRFDLPQGAAQRALDGPRVKAASFNTGPCVHPPIVPRSGAPVEMSAQARHNCSYG